MNGDGPRQKWRTAKGLRSWLLLCPIAFLLLGYLLISSLVTGGKPLTRERAQELARETYRNVYGFTDAQGAAYTLADARELEDGTGYAFTYALGQASFTVRVNATDGSADVDKTLDELRAEAEKPAQPNELSAALDEWTDERSGVRFDFWPLEDKAAFAARYYADTNAAERYCGLPTAQEITADAAVSAAKQALRDRLHYGESDIEALSVAVWFFRDRPLPDGNPSSYYEIVFWRHDDATGEYEYRTQFTVNAATGEA